VKNQHKILLICSLSFLLVFTGNLCLGQGNQLSPDDIEVSFLKDSFEIGTNSFEFNTCNILLNANRNLHAEVKAEGPSFINILSASTSTVYSLNPRQQQLVPLRFIAQSTGRAEWQAITFKIFIRETGQEISARFHVRPKMETRWKAGLTEPEIVLPAEQEKTEVNFWIENTGNVEDLYKLSVQTALPVKPNRSETRLNGHEKKLLSLSVDVKQLKYLKEKKAVLTLVIRNSSGEEKVLVQKLALVGHQYSQEQYGWKTMPLSVELTSIKTTGADPVYAAGINGELSLNEHSRLSVHSRFYNIRQNYNANNLATVQLTSKDWTFTAGSMVGFHHFLVNGNGLDVVKRTERSELHLAAIQTLNSKSRQYQAEWNKDLSKSFSISTDNFSNNDEIKKIYSNLSVNKLRWHPGIHTSIAITGGGSYEKINSWKDGKTISGSVYGYEAETELGRFQLRSRIDNYSESFPGFNKGYSFHDHEVKSKFNGGFLSAYAMANRKIYTNNEDSLLTSMFNVNNEEYGLKAGFTLPAFSLFASAGYGSQQQDSSNAVVVQSWKTTLNLSWKLAGNSFLSVCSNLSLLTASERPGMKPIVATNNYGSFQHKNFGLYFQYNSGPYYYFETKAYLQNQTMYRRLQVSPYYEQPVKKLNSYFRTQLMYNRELPGDVENLSVNNQFVYNSQKLKADLSINSNISLLNKQGSYLSVTVRKSLSLPLYKNAVSNNFKAVLFRDKNSDNLFNEDDEVIPNVNVMVNGELVQTDNKGIIIFKNIGSSSLRLDLSHINDRGWMPTNGYSQALQPLSKEKTVQIPFRTGKSIVGQLVLVADDKSNVGFELDQIRITATNEKGENFYCLTDAEGKFNFNLPTGIYTVSINASVFDNEFRPVELSKTIDLVNNSITDVQFEIRQKKRQINIQRE
jgi:hypothetical protein